MRAPKTFILAVVALVGCGDIIGLGEYTDQDGAIDATGNETSTGDAASDVKADAVTDAGGDGPLSCGTSSVCVPALPSGWAWAVYDPDSRPACATGYATPTDVEEGIDASAATCGCGCTTTNPSCGGNATITAGTNVGCNNVTNQADPTNANCNALTNFATNNGSIAVTAPTPTGGSCTAVPSQTKGAVGYAHQGRTCAYSGTPSGGCASGSVCVPDPAPFTACVSQAGSNACPTGFPTQHLVGSQIADTRGCSPCGCTFDAGTCGGSATFYQNGGCNFGAQVVPANGVCTAVGNHTWRSFTYAPTLTASCTGSAVSADGGVAFTDLTTVCCP
jgi:hypothetical protein